MEKKANPRAKARRQVKRQAKRQAAKQPVKVPAEYVFWCHDGSVFSDINGLAEGLVAMADETFAYHSNLEKQDFSNWVRDVIGDEQLADDLAKAASRLQAAECVTARIALLTGK
jgi:hypothetical protein